MLDFVKKLKVILSRYDLLRLARLLAVVFVAAIFEVFGVFSILPFMQVVSNPSTIESNAWLSWFKSSLNLTSDRDVMVWLGGAVIVIYSLTAVVNILNNWLISRTVWGLSHRI